MVTRALAAFLALAAPARAELSVTAAANKLTVGLNEQVVLTVSVAADSASLPEPELPSMPRFNVHNAGKSQAMTKMTAPTMAMV